MQKANCNFTRFSLCLSISLTKSHNNIILLTIYKKPEVTIIFMTSDSLYLFNSLPHTEVDGCGIPETSVDFIFQLTTSHRGRLFLPNINSANILFQLTTSHRGRLFAQLVIDTQLYFNSLPHTEVDESRRFVNPSAAYFNSLPHTEVDAVIFVCSILLLLFQLTTSHRGRHYQLSNSLSD